MMNYKDTIIKIEGIKVFYILEYGSTIRIIKKIEKIA